MKKKDKEERKEKIIKGVKIGAYCTGLTLCTGLFVALLVVGIRGCASNPRSNTTESAATNKRDVPNYAPLNEYNDLSRSDNWFVWNGHRLSGVATGDYFTNGNYDVNLPISGKVISQYDNEFGIINDTFNEIWVISETNDFVSFVILGDNNYYECVYETDGFLTTYIEDYWGYPSANRIYLYLNDISILNNNDNENYTPAILDLNTLLKYDYQKGYNFDVLFNDVINPFGPLGASFDYFVNLQITGKKTLFRGLFTDVSGNLYTGIELTYLGANGMRFGTSTEYTTYSGSGSHYMTMNYLTLNNVQQVVNAQSYGTTTTGNQSGQTVMLNSNHWISALYQRINIIWMFEDSYTSGYSGSMDRLTAVTSLNNNVGGATGIINGGNTGAIGVFTLIGNAFSSFATIFAVQVLPGVTIWTLLLIPFVVTIILFAVWLFKR